MVLELLPEGEKLALNRDVVHRGASNKGVTQHATVIFHLQQVLSHFARQKKYDKFYIGVTNDVDTRLASHRRNKPEYRWMVPIYEEDSVNVSNAFDLMEQEAIDYFRSGFYDHNSGEHLDCGNGPRGASPKMCLYILIREIPPSKRKT
ncbi:GIY-YIG nuclease family protein [Burkholderia pyrrocinia]|uniref:GIY-YIG nuclease family protein n=1 Tax=Burkholderia pyrrocinia TaxID=60550 RepID=A0ABZ3BDF5_BURPY